MIRIVFFLSIMCRVLSPVGHEVSKIHTRTQPGSRSIGHGHDDSRCLLVVHDLVLVVRLFVPSCAVIETWLISHPCPSDIASVKNLRVVGCIGLDCCSSQEDEGPSFYIHNRDVQVGPDASSAWSGISFDCKRLDRSLFNKQAPSCCLSKAKEKRRRNGKLAAPGLRACTQGSAKL